MSDAGPLSTLTPAQIKQLQREFYALDRDADGRVKAADVQDALRNLGVAHADADAQACFEHAEGGAYELMGFLTMMGGTLQPFADMPKLCEAFESFDEKDEGYIPAETLRDILANDELVRMHG